MKLSVDRLSKQYKNKIAVDRVSFSLTEGVTGLLGANGAGKTTLMRMMTGILAPTSGEITADGIAVQTEEYRYPGRFPFPLFPCKSPGKTYLCG